MHASVLRYFVCVARAGSIRQASEELHVASSAISRQILKLEEELGTSLFERLPNGLRLTRAGEIVLSHARNTLHDFDIMKGELGDLEGKKTGRVRIACLDSLAIQFLPDRVMAFNRQHPAVDFYIRSDNYSQIFGFVDDLELYADTERSVLQARSVSRLGESDLGVNEQRLGSLEAALSKQE